MPADQIIDVSNVTTLHCLVEEESNVLINLTPNDYTAKKQRRGKWKWREKNSILLKNCLAFWWWK